MTNLLLEEVEYQVTRTELGMWRRYLYPSGARFSEFKSHKTWFGLPVIHYTSGICPETGRRVPARGVLAVGRLAAGLVALGQVSFGLIAAGQFCLGILLGLGQIAGGAAAVGQVSIGFLFGLGQIAFGVIAVGQFCAGKYILAQAGLGKYVWTMQRVDMEAVALFKTIFARFIP